MGENDEAKFASVSLQEAISYIQEGHRETRDLVLAQIDLHKLVLRALVDLGHVELDALNQALTKMADVEERTDTEKRLFLGLVKSFEETYAPAGEANSAPHLRVVKPSSDQD